MRNFKFNPFFVVLLIMMGFSSLRQYSGVAEWMMHMALILPGVIIGLSFHEFAHAAMANALGDPTAKNMGRMTINPISHFDPFGFLALLFLGFGWGVPVPVNPNNLKHKRRDDILISIAGVCMNFIIALIAGGIYVFLFIKGFYPSVDAGMQSMISLLLLYIMQINLVLLVFNLIPIPPLDGFHVFSQLFGFANTDFAAKLEQYGFIILMIALIMGIVDFILGPGVKFLTEMIVELFLHLLN